MARLPTAEELGQRPTPSGRGGVSRLQLTTPRRGAEAQAEAEFGRAISGLGDAVAELGFREKAKIDEARAEEAYSKYQDSTLDLEYGQQNGFINIQGGDAVKQPLVDDYRVRREGIAKQIRDSLESDGQRMAFDSRARIVDRQFDARLYRHVAEQSRVYQEQVFESVLATERRAAALNWDQPGQIEMSLLRTDREIERRARITGLSDKEMIDNQKVQAGTMIHADVITHMLLTGKDSAAAAYYERIKNELTPEAMTILGSKVQAAGIEGESLRGADAIWSMLGPKGTNEPVRLDVMEALVRDRYKDRPQEMKAAIADLRSRAVAHNDGQQEMVASNKAAVLDAYHNGMGLKELQTMTEYQALDGENRVQLRDYIVNRGWTEQQHARAEAEYREGAKSSAAFSKYWELSNPQVLSTLSEQQILNLEPVLGRKITEELLVDKRKLNSPENVRAATIDAELFNVIAADAGLKPYDKSSSTEQKEYLGRLRNEVEASIDAEQRRTGKALNREEKEKIMRSMVDKKVLVDDWGANTELPAPVVKPAMRNQIYVPIESVDNSWLKGAMNYMRSTGIAPMDWDDATIKKNMKGRLERAYAISITGGGSEEGRKALEGKDDGIRQ